MIFKNEEIKLKQLGDKTSRKVLAKGGAMMMAEVNFKKGGIGEPHSHDKNEQVSYIVSGSFRATIGDETKILKKGDSYYVPLNVMHGVVALEDSVILDIFTPMREDFLNG